MPSTTCSNISISILSPGTLTLRTAPSHTSSSTSSSLSHAVPTPPPYPPLFAASLAVRIAVFVDEQKVPLENELDEEDVRSWHLVAFEEEEDGGEDARDRNRKKEDKSEKREGKESAKKKKAVGCLRVVPPSLGSDSSSSASITSITSAAGAAGGDSAGEKKNYKEPYVRLSRLAVLSTHRGKGIAARLVNVALEHISTHPSLYSSSSSSSSSSPPPTSIEGVGGAGWSGWVLVHANVEAVGFWRRNGFELDETMGEWVEEGMAHCGMWLHCVSVSG